MTETLARSLLKRNTFGFLYGVDSTLRFLEIKNSIRFCRRELFYF